MVIDKILNDFDASKIGLTSIEIKTEGVKAQITNFIPADGNIEKANSFVGFLINKYFEKKADKNGKEFSANVSYNSKNPYTLYLSLNLFDPKTQEYSNITVEEFLKQTENFKKFITNLTETQKADFAKQMLEERIIEIGGSFELNHPDSTGKPIINYKIGIKSPEPTCK